MTSTRIVATLVEEDVHLDLVALARACRAPEDQIRVWVFEGVLEPAGRTPQEWRFSGSALRRARQAQRLARDFDVNTPGIALALDLMDEIAALRASLRRSGIR